MGVMRCSRPDCENILCRTYVDSVGYICRDCQKEFKNYLSFQKDVIADSHGSISRALKTFMETPAGDYKGEEVDVEAFFENYTNQ